jgi:hypothetical protein
MLSCPFLGPSLAMVSRYAYKYCTRYVRMVVHQQGRQRNNSNKAKHISTEPNISNEQIQEQQPTQTRLDRPSVEKEPIYCPKKA